METITANEAGDGDKHNEIQDIEMTNTGSCQSNTGITDSNQEKGNQENETNDSEVSITKITVNTTTPKESEEPSNHTTKNPPQDEMKANDSTSASKNTDNNREQEKSLQIEGSSKDAHFTTESNTDTPDNIHENQERVAQDQIDQPIIAQEMDLLAPIGLGSAALEIDLALQDTNNANGVGTTSIDMTENRHEPVVTGTDQAPLIMGMSTESHHLPQGLGVHVRESSTDSTDGIVEPGASGGIITMEDLENNARLLDELAQQASQAYPDPPSSQDSDSAGVGREDRRRQKAGATEGYELPLYDQPFEELDEDGRMSQAEFNRKAKAFCEKAQSGTVTPADEISYERLLKAERSRRRKVNLDRKYENLVEVEEPLFEPLDGSDGDIMMSRGISSTNNSTQKRKRDMQNDFRASESTADGEASVPGPSKARETKRARQTKKTPAAKPPETKSSSSSNSRRPKQKGPQMTNISSLMGTDIFTDAVPLQEGERDAERLQLRSRNRANALKDLIASLPPSQVAIAKVEKTALDKAASAFIGRGSCRVAAEDGESIGHWLIKGMKTPLKHFQMLGASWMKTCETSEDEPHGGLCCDDMGLGKTLMTIATIVNGLPPKTERIRATLVIVPSSLIKQWEAEIYKHCNEKIIKGEVMTYSGRPKGFSCNNFDQMLQSAVIVLATHHAVRESCKKIVFPAHCQTQEEKEEWFEENRDEYRGILHRIEFYRVVVDEAHVIKNHLSQTSIAIRELKVLLVF
jgi:SNF2-related domain